MREFLISRRAKITPERAGLPGSRGRRVPGLRRAEVAALAGVSVEYYARLERGAISGVSPSVLNAIAHALQLDDAERKYLFHLAHATDGTSAAMRGRRRPREPWSPEPSLEWVLESVSAPAIVRNGRLDVLAGNQLGLAIHDCIIASAGDATPNLARFLFLDGAAARRFYSDWDQAAESCVAILRAEAGRDPYDHSLRDLVCELTTQSPEFRSLWDGYDVSYDGAGVRGLHHPAVGYLELGYESVNLVSEPGLTLVLYAAEPASPTARALEHLTGLNDVGRRHDAAAR